jgi:hypothetical protein
VRHEESAATRAAWGDARTDRWQRATYVWARRRLGARAATAVALINVAGAAARAVVHPRQARSYLRWARRTGAPAARRRPSPPLACRGLGFCRSLDDAVTGQVTALGIRDGDPAVLRALVDRRGFAVLAFCERACPPGAAVEAAGDAFARFRAMVQVADRPAELDPEAALLSATRHASASRMPRLGVAAPTGLGPPARRAGRGARAVDVASLLARTPTACSTRPARSACRRCWTPRPRPARPSSACAPPNTPT